MSPPVLVPRDQLEQFVESLFSAAGVPPASACLLAESLVAASVRGVDSHGVHLAPHYIRQLRAGHIHPEAEGHVVSESGACLVYDGEHGLGQHISSICTGHAVRLARTHGIGAVVVRDSNHFGAAAFWGQRIASHGFLGVVLCNASPSVPPWQGKEGRIGTNPICVALPTSGKGGWLLDMATTTVAMNKIVKAAANDVPEISPGWAMDSDGIPTTDTMKARRGWLMPLGGYKGSGLGMLVEILCGVLSGGAMSTQVGGLHILERLMNTSQFFLALDVARFMPIEEFRSRMEYLITLVKSTPPASGFDEVLVAGDPEWRAEATRLREGVPVDASTWQQFSALAEELSLRLPERAA